MREKKRENTTFSKNNQLDIRLNLLLLLRGSTYWRILNGKRIYRLKGQQRSLEEKKQRSFESLKHLKLTIYMHSLSESLLRIIRFLLIVKIEKKYFHFERVISPHQMIQDTLIQYYIFSLKKRWAHDFVILVAFGRSENETSRVALKGYR